MNSNCIYAFMEDTPYIFTKFHFIMLDKFSIKQVYSLKWTDNIIVQHEQV